MVIIKWTNKYSNETGYVASLSTKNKCFNNTFEKSDTTKLSPSPFSHEQRLQRALEYIDKHGSIRLQEYANLNSLSRTQASRELAQWVCDTNSGIKASGSGPLKCWVRS